MTSLLPINYKTLSSVSPPFDPTKPIYMLNIWKYKETAEYASKHSALAGSPCSGREAMDRYRTALTPILPPGAARFFLGAVLTEVVAPAGESWDDVAIIRYESYEGFKKMLESKEYVETALPHRVAGLEDARLIMMDKLEF